MKNTELLSIQTNANETDSKESGEELVKFEEIEGTPFTLVEDKEKGAFVVMGNYKLTENYETKEEALKQIEDINYNMIMNVVSIMIDGIGKFKEEEKKRNDANNN